MCHSLESVLPVDDDSSKHMEKKGGKKGFKPHCLTPCVYYGSKMIKPKSLVLKRRHVLVSYTIFTVACKQGQGQFRINVKTGF